MIEWINVDSKKIIRIAYNYEIKMMYINFKGSTTDAPYVGISEEEFNAFSNAYNIDEYYNSHIKHVYKKVNIDTDNFIGCRL